MFIKQFKINDIMGICGLLRQFNVYLFDICPKLVLHLESRLVL